uniref:Uncharacterized protein n=1 Tax=Arundo donax TaxID=35708 RepID=A0A0A8ZUW6_ARUDO
MCGRRGARRSGP